MNEEFSGPFKEFNALLPKDPKVFDASTIDSQNLMLTNFAKEQLDGIWAHQLMNVLPKPGCQRAMAIFFAALKPKGILFISIDTEMAQARELTASDFASLVRQSGFQLLSQGQNLQKPAQIGFLARRI
jgi:hypothetical protein